MTTAADLERIAMAARLGELQDLALRACRGSDLEKQLAASLLVRIAASDWRELLAEDEGEVICLECDKVKAAIPEV